MSNKDELTKIYPSSAELDFLEDRLYEFNSTQTGRDDGQLFAFLIRDEQQEIVAGISGWTWADACEIRELWVHPAWRRQGHGKSLLESAEQEAQDRGCKENHVYFQTKARCLVVYPQPTLSSDYPIH